MAGGLNISGPVESIIIAGRRFECDAEDSGEITLSGMKNEVKRSGSGGKRLVRGFRTGGIKNLNVVVTHENDDLEYLSKLQSTADFFDVSLTHCDGTIYAGSMQFTDDITENTKEGTVGISLEGDLEKQ
jgi:hypothetical protein